MINSDKFFQELLKASCLNLSLLNIYMYAYDIHHLCHSDHTFGFNILPFIATLRQFRSRVQPTSVRCVRYAHAICDTDIHTTIYDISKITYSLLPRNNRQELPCSRYRDRSALYRNKLPH